MRADQAGAPECDGGQICAYPHSYADGQECDKQGTRDDRRDPVHQPLRRGGSAVVLRVQLGDGANGFIDVVWKSARRECVFRHLALSDRESDRRASANSFSRTSRHQSPGLMGDLPEGVTGSVGAPQNRGPNVVSAPFKGAARDLPAFLNPIASTLDPFPDALEAITGPHAIRSGHDVGKSNRSHPADTPNATALQDFGTERTGHRRLLLLLRIGRPPRSQLNKTTLVP